MKLFRHFERAFARLYPLTIGLAMPETVQDEAEFVNIVIGEPYMWSLDARIPKKAWDDACLESPQRRQLVHLYILIHDPERHAYGTLLMEIARAFWKHFEDEVIQTALEREFLLNYLRTMMESNNEVFDGEKHDMSVAFAMYCIDREPKQ